MGATTTGYGGGTLRATLVGTGAILLWAALALFTVDGAGSPSLRTPGTELRRGLPGRAWPCWRARGPAALASAETAGSRPGSSPSAACSSTTRSTSTPCRPHHPRRRASSPISGRCSSCCSPPRCRGKRLRLRHLVGSALGLGGTAMIILGRGTERRRGRLGGVGLRGGLRLRAGLVGLFGAEPALRGGAQRHAGRGLRRGGGGGRGSATSPSRAERRTEFRPVAAPWCCSASGPTGLAFLAWDHATKHGRLPVLGALSYLAPLVSTLLLILTGLAEGSLMLIGRRRGPDHRRRRPGDRAAGPVVTVRPSRR